MLFWSKDRRPGASAQIDSNKVVYGIYARFPAIDDAGTQPIQYVHCHIRSQPSIRTAMHEIANLAKHTKDISS